MARPLRHIHVGMYGAVMGLAGLGLTARAAAPLFPGTFRAPSYFTEPWILASVIMLLVLLVLYAIKLVRDPKAVQADFTDAGTIGFCGALPVGMTLVAGGLAPYLPQAASCTWWTGSLMLLAFQVWALSRWLAGFDIAKLNAGWLIVMVGGIVVPGPGIALGHTEASHFFFGVSATVAPVLVALLLYRAAAVQPLPDALKPTWFILLVPPSLIYANGMALFGFEPLEHLYYFALALTLALFVYARGFFRWPFAPSWWAFTFPLDSLAYAAVRYAQAHPTPLWRGIAFGTLSLATLVVAAVLLRTLRSAASRAA